MEQVQESVEIYALFAFFVPMVTGIKLDFSVIVRKTSTLYFAVITACNEPKAFDFINLC